MDLTAFLLLPLAILLRWLPGRKTPTNFDTWFYLLSTVEIRRRGIATAGPLRLRMLPTSEIHVPLLWQRLMALLPPVVIRRHHKWVGAVSDGAFAASLYYISLVVGFAPASALLVVLLYLFTPMWFTRLSVGPRVHSLTPRLTSEIFANYLFILLYAGLPVDRTLSIVVATALACFLLLSSKFGIQVLFFMLPLASAIDRDPAGIVVLGAAVAACMIVTRGAFTTALSAQGHHLRNYFRKNLRGEMPMARRNSLAPLRRIVTASVPLRMRLGRLMSHLLVLNSYSAVLLKLPAVPVAAIIYLALRPAVPSAVPWAQWGAPLLAALVVYLVVNIRYFLFLGEAERYLNHAAWFIAAVVVVGAEATGAPWLPWMLVAYGGVYWLIETFLLDRIDNRRHAVERDNRALVRWLNEQTPTTVALYPYHAVGVWRVLLETSHTVIYPARTNADDEAQFARFDAAYPHFNIERFPEMAHAYGCRLLIAGAAEKVAVDRMRSTDGWKEVATGGSHYVVFQAAAASVTATA